MLGDRARGSISSRCDGVRYVLCFALTAPAAHWRTIFRFGTPGLRVSRLPLTHPAASPSSSTGTVRVTGVSVAVETGAGGPGGGVGCDDAAVSVLLPLPAPASRVEMRAAFVWRTLLRARLQQRLVNAGTAEGALCFHVALNARPTVSDEDVQLQHARWLFSPSGETGRQALYQSAFATVFASTTRTNAPRCLGLIMDELSSGDRQVSAQEVLAVLNQQPDTVCSTPLRHVPWCTCVLIAADLPLPTVAWVPDSSSACARRLLASAAERLARHSTAYCTRVCAQDAA